MIISCSNDKTLKLWKIRNPLNAESSSIDTYAPGFYINNLHTDYVTSLAYSEKSSAFFSAGYDGKLFMMKLDEKTIAIRDIVIHREFYALGTNNSSIYSIDCDLEGKILLASIYENVNHNKKLINFFSPS